MVEVKVRVKPITVSPARWLTPIALIGIVLLGGLLRLNGLEWDQKAGYHPDERFIRMVTADMAWPASLEEFLDRRQSPLNPYFDVKQRRERAFAYGTLPVYLTKAVGGFLAENVDKKWDDYDWIGIVGRAISGVLDTLAIIVVFLIGRRVFGRAAGLLGALLYALTVLSIQHSHFYTTDITLNFFVVLAIYFALDLVKKGSLAAGFATGAAIGMALASKISAAPVVLLVPVALLLHLRERALAAGRPLGDYLNWPNVSRLIAPLASSIVGVLVLHFVFAPYTFLDLNGLLKNFQEQNAILITGEADRPFTRQYYDTAPYVYYIEQMVRWSLGAPLGIASLIGLGLITASALRKTPYTAASVLILTWIVPYFLITGRSQAKFLRYMLPILPLLALSASVLLVKAVERARAWAANGRPGARAVHAGAVALAGVVVAATAWWALAFSSIYAEPHTANRASAWMNANLPKDAVIVMEHWEEGIAGLQGFRTPPGQVQLQSYEEDNANKVRMYAEALARGDTIQFFSNRLYGTVPRIPDRYPMSRKFYELLFNGELGFELVHFEQSYPRALGIGVIEDTFARPGLPYPEPLRGLSIAPITLNGGFADESFSAYDHPLVMIWRKVRPVAAQDIVARLTPFLPDRPWSPQLARANNRQPVLSDDAREVNQAGGTFAELFDERSVANQAPLLFWLLALAALTLVGAPLVMVAGKSLPDRGFIFSPVIGLLLVGWLIWMPVSAGLADNTRWMAFAGLALGALVSGLVAFRHRVELLAWLRSHARLIALEQALWLIAFVAFMLVRMGNPDLWHPARGGEKPMDFAYLMATLKSSTLPPYDPWFAGGYINYYYYGQYLVSVVIKLTGVLPEVAYNLAIPTLFAMTLTGAFSIAYNLVALWRRRGEEDAARVSKLAVAAGVVSGLMMAVLGNMDGGARLFRRLVQIGGPGNIPEQAVWALPFGDVLSRFVGGIGRVLAEGDKVLQIPTDWYWGPTRIYPGSGSIQEFPYFTFLYADLHAHMIAMPFALLTLALAVALAVWVRDAALEKADAGALALLRERFSLPRVLLVGLAGLSLGSLWTINSWDYPGYSLVIGLSMMLAWWQSPRGGRLLAFTLIAGLSVAALSNVFYAPFHNAFVQGYNGFRPQDERSPLTGYVTVYFAFLLAVVSWAAHALYRGIAGGRASGAREATVFESVRAAPPPAGMRASGRRPRGGDPLRAARMIARRPESMARTLSLMAALEAAPRSAQVEPFAAATAAAPSTQPAARAAQSPFVALAIAALVIGLAVRLIAGAFGPVAAVSAGLAFVMLGLAAVRRQLSESVGFALAALAFVFTAGVEIWALEGDIGRMNTVFKFYLQAWSLLAVASGLGAAILVSRIRSGARLWAGLFAVALLVGAVYPVVASSAKIRDRWDEKQAPTLNGMQYMQTSTYTDEADFNGRRVQAPLALKDDLDAIRWIRANVAGSPVMLEAASGPPPHPGLYRWGGRVSIYTGLPTVVGWDWHQRQQRLGTIDVERRVNDVLAIYTAPDVPATQRLLASYKVRYVYYGAMEKLHYPAGDAKLAAMAASGALKRVYDGPNVAIYEVAAQ